MHGTVHSSTEIVIATSVLTTWFWGMVLGARAYGPQILANLRFNRTFKKVKAGVEATGYHLHHETLRKATRQLLNARAVVKNGPLTYTINDKGEVIGLDVDPEFSTIPCGHIIKRAGCAHCQHPSQIEPAEDLVDPNTGEVLYKAQ